MSTSEQARADALADAACAYMVLVREAHAIGTSYFSEISRIGREIQLAHSHGSIVSAYGRWHEHHEQAAEYAVLAARAAFRAVPGLRGDK